MANETFVRGNQIATLTELLQVRAAHQPDALAYKFLTNRGEQETPLTYAELDGLARSIGGMLQEKGLKGERALLLYPPGLEFIAAFFGCLYAGVIAVPLFPPQLNRPLDRIEMIARDAQSAVILTTSPMLSLIKRFFADMSLLEPMRLCLATDDLPNSSVWQPAPISPENVAFLQYTSGSTSNPKGVMIQHVNLLHNLEVIYQAFGMMSEDRGFFWLPPYHDLGLIGGIFEPLYAGIPMAFMSPMDFLKHPISWLQAISRDQATVSGGPNFAYDLCVRKHTPEQLATLDLSSWQVAFCGAEPIRAETLDRFSKVFAPYGFRPEAFYPCYGLAEATLFVTGALRAEPPVSKTFRGTGIERNQVIAAAGHDPDARILISSGRTWLDQKTVIVNSESLLECEVGQIGEIWTASDSVAAGYWNRPQETEQTFRAYIANTGAGPFLRTGDLGFIQDGELFVAGRLKDMIIIDGHNHYPQDIEQTVESSHLAIKSGYCAAFSVDLDSSEQLVIVAKVRPYPGKDKLEEPELKTIETSIRRNVATVHNIRPYRVVLLVKGDIPKTSSGKIQRYLCRARFLENRLTASE
jgi:acyl-CoA synthetase (AMP-forming)/AMP-acid ligase II